MKLWTYMFFYGFCLDLHAVSILSLNWNRATMHMNAPWISFTNALYTSTNTPAAISIAPLERLRYFQHLGICCWLPPRAVCKVLECIFSMKLWKQDSSHFNHPTATNLLVDCCHFSLLINVILISSVFARGPVSCTEALSPPEALTSWFLRDCSQGTRRNEGAQCLWPRKVPTISLTFASVQTLGSNIGTTNLFLAPGAI